MPTIGLLAFVFTESALQRSIMDRQVAQARQTMNRIDRLLYERLIDIQQIGGEDEIGDYLAEGADVNLQRQRRLRLRMGELAVVTGPWDVLFVVDKRGKIALSADDMLLGDDIAPYTHKKVAYDVSMRGSTYHSDLVISKDTGFPTVIFSSPIRSEADGSILGVVVGNFSWPAIIEVLRESEHMATLLNREGDLIGRPDMMEEPSVNLEGGRARSALSAETNAESWSFIFTKDEGASYEESLTSVAVQTGYLSYKGNDWRLALEAPVREAFAPARRAATQLVQILIPLLLLMPLLIFFVIRVMVLRPIRSLSRAIQATARGDLSSRVQLRSRDELSQLGESFNVMTAKLQGAYDSLENKVKERTRELELSKKAALNMMQDAEEARAKAESSAEKLKNEMDERKKVERQLLQSQKMETVGTLAGGIAHDLNNQLTPVKGYIDLILSGTKEDDPNHPLLVEANQSVTRCAEVIHRLLNFSRASGQKGSVISVQKMLAELKGLVGKLLPSTIAVEVECAEDVHPVEGSETELQTVFMNLAANARDAMPDGGRLRIRASNVTLSAASTGSAERHGEFVLVSVTDTGMGIPPDVLDRIFEPFFTTKKKGEGTGLGLAMVFKIVKECGGWVGVSSKMGEGTTFQVYLAAKRGVKVEDTRKQAVDLALLAGKGETVLFADDEEMIRHMGRVLLEKLGYKVVTCSDAQQVVDAYREGHRSIDALLVDMTMPRLSGKQMLKEIFAIRPDAKVIVASGYTSEGNREDIHGMGAAYYLQKPYTIEPLARSLRALLTGSCPI